MPAETAVALVGRLLAERGHEELSPRGVVSAVRAITTAAATQPSSASSALSAALSMLEPGHLDRVQAWPEGGGWLGGLVGTHTRPQPHSVTAHSSSPP